MSSINPVGRSMNGIKTIETASLIFTDDNSSLNTSAGIVSAQANSTTALNGKINSIGFNTSNGVLTLTKEDNTTISKDLDGRYVESLSTCVLKTTDQTIDGVKTFTSFPVKSGTSLADLTPTTDGQLTPKKYLDHKLGEIDTIIDTLEETFYDDATITTDANTGVNTLTLSRPDAGAGTTDLILPQTSLSTCVLKTTAQEIDGIKTFVEFPKKKLDNGTLPNPTADEQFATKKYVDDNAGSGDAVLNGANAFTGTNTFNNSRPTSTIIPNPNAPAPPDPAQDDDFIMKRDGDLLYRTLTNNSFGVLDINVSGNQQDLLRLNAFKTDGTTRTLTIKTPADVDDQDDPFIFHTNNAYKFIVDNINALEIDAFGNVGIERNINFSRFKFFTNGYWAGLNITTGNSSITRLYIEPDDASKPLYIYISAIFSNPLTIGNPPTVTPTYDLQDYFTIKNRGGIYLDGLYGIRIPRKGLYDRTGEREWRIDHASKGSAYQSGVNNLVFYFSSVNGGNASGTFIAKARLQANGRLELASTLLTNMSFSDDRLKTNEVYLENATESLLKLSVQTYDKATVNNFNLEEKTGETIRETGLIAQEVYYNAPEFRGLIDCGTEYNDEFDLSGNQTGDGNPEGTKIIPDEMDLSGVPIDEDPDYEGAGWSKTERASIQYQGFIAYLIKSNQELHERILKLENKIGDQI